MESKGNELDEALASIAEIMKKDELGFIRFELKLFKPKEGPIIVEGVKITNKNGLSETI